VFIGLSHAGAAAFAAMKAYEHKKANEGEPVSHPMAKEALAALVGFEIGETYGISVLHRSVTPHCTDCPSGHLGTEQLAWLNSFSLCRRALLQLLAVHTALHVLLH